MEAQSGIKVASVFKTEGCYPDLGDDYQHTREMTESQPFNKSYMV